MEQPIQPLLLSIKETKARAGWSPATIYRLLRAGKIAAKKSGARTMILADSVDACVNSLPDWKPDSAAAA